MNLVKVLTLAPSELRTEKEIKSPLVQSGSADLESAQSDDNTGNLSMESLPLLDSMLDMAVESHMAHCGVTFRRLQGWSYSDYGPNENDNTCMVQTSRRGRSSDLLLHPFPLLSRSQVLNRIFMPLGSTIILLSTMLPDPVVQIPSMLLRSIVNKARNPRINKVILSPSTLFRMEGT